MQAMRVQVLVLVNDNNSGLVVLNTKLSCNADEYTHDRMLVGTKFLLCLMNAIYGNLFDIFMINIFID